MTGEKVTTAQAAALLGYASPRSIRRLQHAGRIAPAPFPKCPRHYWKADVLALNEGRRPMGR